MKQVWKRALSLVLSGVLLLGSLPLGALATEETTAPTETMTVETEPVVTEPVVTEPIETQSVETQPVVTSLEHTAEVANDQSEDETPITPELLINGTKYENTLGNVSYDTEILKLSGTDAVKTIEAKNMSLTIVLSGKNKMEGTTAMITVDGALTIQGEGSLEVVTAHHTAISVGGSGEGENKKGFVINGTELFVETSYQTPQGETQQPVGIDSGNGIEIKGAAHFKTNASKSENQYVMEHVGYFNGEPSEANKIHSTGGSIEFISSAHLSDKINDHDAEKHFRTCKDNDCPMRSSVRIDEAPHGTETTYIVSESVHQEVLACCRRTVNSAAAENCSYEYVSSEAVLSYQCKTCKDVVGKLTIAPPSDLVWNNANKTVTMEAEGSLVNKYTLDHVKYYQVNEDGTTGVETQSTSEPGSYVAVLVAGDQETEIQAAFTINKKPLSQNMINEINNRGEIPYDSIAEAGSQPGITLTDKEITVNGEPRELTQNDYEVKAYRGENADQNVGNYTDPGTITFMIEAKQESQYYTSPAEPIVITYTIPKEKPNADMFAFTAPDVPTGTVLTYDGKEKNANIGVNGGYAEAGLGEITKVEWYKDDEVTQKPFIDAGVYTVKISVAEGENYTEKNDLTDDDWTFTIEPADVSPVDAINRVYTDHTVEQQLVSVSMGGFTGPSFTGYIRAGAEAPDSLTGTVTYTYDTDNKTTEDIGTVNDYLNGLQDGATVTIGYELAPNVPNYTGKTRKREVSLTKTTIVVKANGVAGTSAQNGLAIKAPNPKYGDKIVDTSKLTVHIGDSEEAIPGTFTVKYSRLLENGNYGEQIALEKPDVGSYKFYVYYSNVSRSNTNIQDLLVAEGDVNIGKQTPSVTVTAAANLTDTDAGDPLVTVDSSDETIKYSIDNGGTWLDTVPVVAAQHGSGVFSVQYKVEDDGNYTAKTDYDPVEVVVTPYLTATYGTTLAQVQEQIECASGTWTFEEPGETKVGDVNTAGNSHNMSFTPDGVTQATKTNTPVKIYVSAAHITLDFDVVKTHHSYTGSEIQAAVTVKQKADSNAQNAALLDPFPSAEYQLSYSDNKNPGKATVTISSKGNYIFDNTEEELTKEFVIYRLGSLSLKDDATAVPPELKDDNGTKYETGADIKDALSEKYDKTAYPENRRTYIKFLMRDKDSKALYDEFYWPSGGTGTLTWEYDNIVNKDDDFKIYGMYMVTSERLDTEAGEIFEMKEVTSGSLGVNEFYVGTDGIQFKLKNYAVLCFAAEADPAVEYTITKAVSPSSSYGTVSVKADSKAVSKATYGTKLTITATAKSGYSLTSVTVTDANSKSVTATKVSEGNYELTMPASNIKVTAKFSKTTSSAKNPNSGDTSNIYLWLTILAASAVGIVALVIVWFIKRRK